MCLETTLAKFQRGRGRGLSTKKVYELGPKRPDVRIPKHVPDVPHTQCCRADQMHTPDQQPRRLIMEEQSRRAHIAASSGWP